MRTEHTPHSMVPTVDKLREFLIRDNRHGFVQTLDDLEEQLEAARSDIDAMEQLISYLGEEHLSSQAEAHLRTFWASRESNPANSLRKPGRSSECGHSWWVPGCSVCEREKKDALAEQSPAKERPLNGGGSLTATPLPPGAESFQESKP